ncbi:hypothetical protein GQ607_015066, partial [Colletotrichum asianum]
LYFYSSLVINFIFILRIFSAYFYCELLIKLKTNHLSL